MLRSYFLTGDEAASATTDAEAGAEAAARTFSASLERTNVTRIVNLAIRR